MVHFSPDISSNGYTQGVLTAISQIKYDFSDEALLTLSFFFPYNYSKHTGWIHFPLKAINVFAFQLPVILKLKH